MASLRFIGAAVGAAALALSPAAQAQTKVISTLDQLEGQRVALRYLDRNLVPLPSAEGAYAYDILRRADSLGVRWRVRRFTVQGHQPLLDAGYAGELPGQVPHVRVREWYPSGQLREDVSYRLGKPDGPMKTYYPSGKLRRDQQNKAGAVFKSECFAADGRALDECPGYRTAAKLAGKGSGQAAVFQSMQRQFIQFVPKTYARATDATVHVAFLVDSLGFVRDARVLASDDAQLSPAALETVRKLPRLVPATEHDQPVSSVMEGEFYFYPSRRSAAAK